MIDMDNFTAPGAVVLGDDVVIGKDSSVWYNAVVRSDTSEFIHIGAGSLVTKNAVIPSGSMAFGRPAKVIRALTPEEIESNRASAEWYVKESAALR